MNVERQMPSSSAPSRHSNYTADEMKLKILLIGFLSLFLLLSFDSFNTNLKKNFILHFNYFSIPLFPYFIFTKSPKPESDNRAKKEKAEKQVKENKETILRLRKENKEQRRMLSKLNLVSQ